MGYVPAVIAPFSICLAWGLLGPAPEAASSTADPEALRASEPPEGTSARATEDPEVGGTGDSKAETGEDAAAGGRGRRVRRPRAPTTFSVSALVRAAALPGDTRRLTQPFGYGFALDFGIMPWTVQRAHFGFFVFGGHVRAPELIRVPPAADPMGATSPRWQRVSHTDFAGGLMAFMEWERANLGLELGAGLAISDFTRPQTIETASDERVEGLDPTLRGRVSVGVPIRDGHGIVFGLAVTNIFSGVTAPLSALDPEGETARPFDLISELDIGYQARF